MDDAASGTLKPKKFLCKNMKYIEGGASSSIEGIGVQKIRRLKITPVSVVASQQLYFY